MYTAPWDRNACSQLSTFQDSSVGQCSDERQLELEGEVILQMNPRHRNEHRKPPSHLVHHHRQSSSPLRTTTGHSLCTSRPSDTAQQHAAAASVTSRPHGLPKMRSLKFAPECTEPLDQLQISMEKLKHHKPLLRGRSVSMEFQAKSSNHHEGSGFFPTSNYFKPSSSVKSNTIDTSARQRHRPHLSVPFFSPLRTSPQRCDTAPKEPHILATPFLHRSALTSPARKEELSTFPSYKSYIDITPEQIHRAGARRKKLRKILARASGGVVLGWAKIFGENSKNGSFA